MWYENINSSNCVSDLMSLEMFSWKCRCSIFTHFASCVCHSTCGTLELPLYFCAERCWFEGAWCQLHSFCNISLAVNITVLTVRLMKEGSDINIPDFGRRNSSYFAVRGNNSQCIKTWFTNEHNFETSWIYKYDWIFIGHCTGSGTYN